MKLWIAAFALSCSAAAPETHSEWCLSHFCMQEATVFAPQDADLAARLKLDLQRMSKATGRDELSIDVEGIPVVWQSPIIDHHGVRVCAETVVSGFSHEGGSLLSNSGDAYTQAIHVDKAAPFCPDPSVSLLHELIHALAPKAHHVETDDSLFSAIVHHEFLDEPALTRLCSYFKCDVFQVEVPVYQ